jgi:hypothetical protein
MASIPKRITHMSDPIKAGMKDQTSTNIARDGAAKRPQTSFAPASGMKDMTALSGIGPRNPGVGPDASSPNVLGGAPKITATEFKPAMGMKGSHSHEQGRQVLGEAIQ